MLLAQDLKKKEKTEVYFLSIVCDWAALREHSSCLDMLSEQAHPSSLGLKPCTLAAVHAVKFTVKRYHCLVLVLFYQ